MEQTKKNDEIFKAKTAKYIIINDWNWDSIVVWGLLEIAWFASWFFGAFFGLSQFLWSIKSIDLYFYIREVFYSMHQSNKNTNKRGFKSLEKICMILCQLFYLQIELKIYYFFKDMSNLKNLIGYLDRMI